MVKQSKCHAIFFLGNVRIYPLVFLFLERDREDWEMGYEMRVWSSSLEELEVGMNCGV